MDAAEIPKKRRKDHSRRLAPVDFDVLEQKLFTVLKREANALLDRSFRGKLSEEDAKDLSNYMTLLKKIKEDELKALSSLDSEKLKIIAQKGEK